MKLRLENGNFSIKRRHDGSSDTTTYDSLPKGLTIADFIGVLVENIENGQIIGFSAVSNAIIGDDGEVACAALESFVGKAAVQFFYNPLNGKVGENPDVIKDVDSSDDSGSDDSGSGGEEGK